jgi:site-specific DNA recombinase
VQRWNLPDGWVISARPAHLALVSEDEFIAAQDVKAARGPTAGSGCLAAPDERRYLLAGLLVCGTCGRRMESSWSNGKAAYRCRHGHTSAAASGPGHPKNAYMREDRALPHLPALQLLLTRAEPLPARRRRTRRGVDVRSALSPQNVVRFLRENEVALVYDQTTGTLQAGTSGVAKTIAGKAS